MTSKIEKKENSVVELLIELTPEEFVTALKAAYKKQSHRFNVPGFRKGKAPYHLAMNYYGEGVLYDEAIDQGLGDAYAAAIEEHKLEPVARPDVKIEEIGSEKGLRARLQVTVLPDVTLGEYKGVEAERVLVEVTEEQVEAELKKMQERSGRMVPVEDRAAELGDTARIDFKGFLNDEPFEGGEGTGHDLILGSQSFIPGFEDQVVGHKPGESFSVNVTFPTEYHAKELAGQEARFEVTLHSLKVKDLPELDDEFAKDVSEFDTLAEYKDSLRAKLEDQAKKQAESAFEDRVVAAAVETATIEIPEAMIEQEVNQTLRQQEQSMAYQGIQLNQYLQYVGKTLEELKKEMRPNAERTVKTGLVLDAIADAENFEVTAEDRKAEYERMAAQYGMKVEEIEKHFGEDSAQLRSIIRSRKVVKFLVEHAKTIEPKPEKPAKKPAKKKAAKAEKTEKEN